MIEFNPHCLYSREDLREMLDPLGINVNSFIAKIKPIRRFRLAYWGQDLINAVNQTEPITMSETPALPSPRASTGRKRGGGRRPTTNPLGPLERLIRGSDTDATH